MPKAVRFDNYGGIDVLRVEDVSRPVPGEGQVLVQVKAAGINPGEDKIREGLLHERWPATFPSGQGSDLAGVVAETGPGVTGFSAGDEVLGWTDNRASQAEYALAGAADLTAKPAGVHWEAAGALFVAGTTAYAAVRAVALSPGDTVVVAGASGGVGTIAVQLARRAGATVIGLASEPHHAWLTAHGVIPVRYGDGVADRVREAACARSTRSLTPSAATMRGWPWKIWGSSRPAWTRSPTSRRPGNTGSRGKAARSRPAPRSWPNWPG